MLEQDMIILRFLLMRKFQENRKWLQYH